MTDIIVGRAATRPTRPVQERSARRCGADHWTGAVPGRCPTHHAAATRAGVHAAATRAGAHSGVTAHAAHGPIGAPTAAPRMPPGVTW